MRKFLTSSLALWGLLGPLPPEPVHAAQRTELDGSGTAHAAGTDPMEYRGLERELRVRPPRYEDPDIRIDGRLSEPEWQAAALLSEFTQYEPVEGLRSENQTEVRVFYAPDAIYFGIRAFDAEPDQILARMGERDRAPFADDWIRVWLDTFNDHRQAYIFYVSPLGLQADGLWIEGLRGGRGGSSSSVDFNPDFIWDSGGRVTADGWEAEIRIPYVSIRFREVPLQDWGVNIAREVKRKGFKHSWAPLTKEISSTLSQGGTLVGLEDLHPRRLVEINPVATGLRAGQNDSGAFEHDDFGSDFGINGRVGITQNLVLDATINPDFSQVEADEDRITVNQRFALFFAEKRPFFLEGTEVFKTPKNLVHTRRIADPLGGAKVSGKVGSFNVGYLGALDEGPVTRGEGEHRAVFNLFRIRRDLGAGSTLGALYTDRTLEGGGDYNRVASVDARLVFGGRYTLTTQLANSWNKEPDEADVTSASLIMASLARSGRSFGFTVRLEDIPEGFNTASGFIPRVGDTELFGSVRFTRFGEPGARVERASLDVRVNSFFAHDDFWDGGGPFEAELELQPNLVFSGGRSLSIILRSGYFEFQPGDYTEYEVEGAGGELRPFEVPAALENLKALAFIPRARITNSVNVSGRLFLREVPIFQEAARGFELQFGPTLTLRPTTSLGLTLSHTLSRLWRTRDDSLFSSTNLSRLRLQYQFTRAFLARVIGQYNLVERSALRDPRSEQPLWRFGLDPAATASGTFQGQILVQYEPSPGTIVYAGYARIMEGERGYSLSRMNPTEDGLFFKLSYLFRM